MNNRDWFILKSSAGGYFRFTEHGSDVKDIWFADRLSIDSLENVKKDLNKRPSLNHYTPIRVELIEHSFEIDFEEAIKDSKRQQALRKLTEEEKALLGLT